VARDAVSLHYVSQAEATLLHEVLSHPHPPAPLTAGDIYRRWPKKASDVGHYSVPLRDEAEAERVRAFLVDHLVVRRASCLPM
jgi:hypothetical protein